jgi:hypothetical protein
MKGFHAFRFSRVLASRFGTCSLLAVLIALSSTLATYGQEGQTFKCPEKSYTFVGTPEQTLCEQYPNFSCATQIGVGTPYSKSSLLGSSVSGNVCVVGDFEVDSPFSFLNAVVKISPNVTISVKPSVNGYDSGSSLVINGSKMFACTGLWKGITLGHLTFLSTSNYSKIEDAEKAIYASGLCALNIQQTTFNRNRIGIELDTPYPNNSVPGPLVWIFTGNRFTCDAPLNGTTDEITEAGVKLKNSYLYTFQSGLNRFTDLKYGIYAEGGFSHIGANGLFMQRIKKNGIYMEQGSINLTDSRFFACEEKGINIETAKLVNVKNTRLTMAVNPVNDPSAFRTGIYINKFALNADVQFNGINFGADMTGTTNKVIGIHLKGGNVGSGTKIRIGGSSNFSIRAKESKGIYLDGIFPATSTTEIWGNNFTISTISGDQSRPKGIHADGGDKNNLSIKWNTFTSYSNANIPTWATGIELRGNTAGVNNEVRVNTFSDANEALLQYIISSNFQNTFYCSNIFSGFGGLDFEFWGTCTGTTITGNTITGTGYGIVIRPNALIGQQKHQGNTWFEIATPSFIYGPVYHAWSEGNPLFNKFTVHTDQSTCPLDPTCHMPYHPERIEPDLIDEFFKKDPDGTPSEGCNDEFTGGDTDELDRRVAQGTFAPPSNDPAMGWVLQRYLYQKFKVTPSLTSEHTSFPAFLTGKENTTVGKFYDVGVAIENALKAGANVDAPSVQALSDIRGLLESMAAGDVAIEQQGLTAALKAQKEGLILQIHSRYWDYNSLRTLHEAQVVVNLQTAYNQNQAIATTLAYETNEKTVNQIHLISLMQQAGELTEAQVTALQSIAQQDIKQGGPAVPTALGMLPECVGLDIQYEYLAMPNPRDLEYARMAEERKGNEAIRTASGISVSPNPASASFSVRNPNGKIGTLTLFDISGRTWLQQLFAGQEIRIDLKIDTPPGAYLLRFVMQDGTTSFEKLIIQPN